MAFYIPVTYAQEATPAATETPAPAITSTPDPTPTEIPSPTPAIDPSPTAIPSATPTSTPDPTPTPTPTPSPSPSPDISPVPETSSSASLKTRQAPSEKKIKKAAGKNYVEGQVLVKFRENKINLKQPSNITKAEQFAAAKNLEVEDTIEKANVVVLETKDEESVENAVIRLEKDSNVEYAEPNYIGTYATISSDDTFKNELWGLDNFGQTVNGDPGTNDADIDGLEAWGVTEGSNSVVVAILDTGVAYNHPDLQANMWDGTNCKNENGVTINGCNHGFDFEDNDKTPLPSSNSHGTHVAGTIAAIKGNNTGIVGVAPNIKIMALKIGSISPNVAAEIKAIDFAIQNGVKIINASYTTGPFSQAEYDAINRFKNAGGTFIVAAGNSTFNIDTGSIYPCDHDLDNIICVAATDQNDSLASFSNYGATSVDVAAPGVNIYSTIADLIGTEVLNEPFTSVVPPALPSGWVKTGNWGTYDFGDDVWGKVLYGDLALLYASNANSTVTSATYNLSGASGVDMGFWAVCDTEYVTDGWHDYMALEVSGNGTDFTEVLRWNEAYLDDDMTENNSGSHTLDYLTSRIPGSMLTSGFQFRLRWVTDADSNKGTGDGCYVDNITINKYSLGSTELYDYYEGTSMATPHVVGVAALVWSHNPARTYSEVKNIILNSADVKTSLDGKVTGSRRLNAHQALLATNGPTITGLDNDPNPTKSKIWTWNSDDPTAQFRHLIDQTDGSVPSGAYSDVKTATQSTGDGIYYLHVQAKSAAGVESAVTTVSAVLDNTASEINVTNPLPGVAVNGSSTVEFTNTEEVNPECSINNSDWIACTSGVTTLSALTGFSALAEGSFTLYVTDTDAAGNTGSDTEAGIIKDTTAPTGSITSPANGLTFTSNPPFTASSSDINGVSSVKFQYKASTSGSFIDINTDTSTPFEANWSGISLVSNTTYDLKIIVEDTAGNSATFSGVSFTYDITAPDQPIITNPASSIIVNSDNYSIQGTAETDSLVKVYSGSSVVGSQQLSDVETGFSISVPLAQDAINSFEVSSTDRVGNESVKTTVSVIAEDSTDPGIDNYTLDNPVISPQVSVGIKDTATIDLLFSEEVDYSIKIKNDSSAAVRSWIGTATNPQPKIWVGKDTDGSYVADGTYTIEIIITDEANNSTTDTSKAITVNNDPLTLDPVGDKNVNENETLTFTASASNSEGSPVSFSLSGEPAGASIDSSTGVFSWTPTEAQGPGSYTLNVNAASGDLFKSEEITITVYEVNIEPVANDGSLTTNEDTDGEITLTATDSDIPANTLTYSIVTDPTHGTVTLVGSVATYTPAANYNGPDLFTFNVDDTSPLSSTSFSLLRNAAFTQNSNFFKTLGLDSFMLASVPSDTATITITVNPVNDLPVITTSAPITATEDELYTYDADISDVDGPGAAWSKTDLDTCGGIMDSVTGVYTFMPTGPVPLTSCVLSIEINDGGIPPLSAIETTTITIVPVNDAPTANDGTAETDEDNPVDISLTGSDPEGDTLTYSINTNPPHGSVSLSGNQATYTPNPGFNGSDTFTFMVNDGLLNSNVATITVTITGINDAPVISPIEDQVVDEYFTLTITPAVTDVDSSTFTFALVNSPAVPNSSIDANTGVFTFIPDETQGGSIYYFTIEANDGNDINNTGTESFAVTVNEINNKPTALDDAVAMDEDSIALIPHSDLLTNDTDPDNVLGDFSITSVANPSPVGSTVIINGLNIEFTTPTDFNGIASFEYTMSDGYSTDTATVTVTVNPVNDAPVAQNDTASFDEDTILIIGKGTLLSNDTDVDEDTLVLSAVFNPANGTVSIDGDNVIFTPNANYNGSASFEYTVSDGNLTDTGTVSITVNSINDAPSFGPISNQAVDEDSSSQDIFITNVSPGPGNESSQTVTFAATSSDSSIIPNPTVTGSGSTRTLTYMPSTNQFGAVTITVSADDGQALNNTFSRTFTITVNPINDAPVCNDVDLATDEDTQGSTEPNCTDVEGDGLTYQIVAQPNNGTASLGSLIYNPDENFNGTDEFTYKAIDTFGAESDVAFVNVTIEAVNDAPMAEDDEFETGEDLSLEIFTDELLANDDDVDEEDMLSVTNVSNPVNGTVEIDIDTNIIIFTPTANYFGPAGFDYTVTDGEQLTDTATVTVTVYSVNDAPVADDGVVTTSQEVPVTIDLSASDIDEDTLTYLIVSGVSHGTLGTIINNQVDYTPNANYTGTDSFTFKANDGILESNTATISITVNPPPVISSEATNTPSETSVTITWATDHPSTSRVIYDTVPHSILDVAPNYGYANSTVETDTSPKVTLHSVTINGLVAGTTYYYRVVSHGSPEVVGDENTFTTESKQSSDGEVAGTSTTSSTSSVCSDQKPGSAPTLISIISGGLNEVTLTWTKAKDPVTYYLIAFGTKSGEMLYGNPFVGGKDTTSYTVKGLSSGTRYYFRVRAGNNCMPGDFSNELSAVAYGEALTEIPEGFSPGVLGEEATTTEEVLGEETASPTPEISPVPQGGRSRRNIILAGIGVILLAAGYFFFIRRKRE